VFEVETRNIAGIDMPAFKRLAFEPVEYDLFSTDPWFDDVFTAVEKLAEYKLHHTLLEEQLHLLEEELLITSQRVNLFEKVKIPQGKENIRRIQIYLGDQQTNAVGRAKLAKGKIKAKEAA
jgi:V/A-type H+-transporting ATPase subunit D